MSIDSLVGSLCHEVVIRERVTEHVPSLADYCNSSASSRRLHRPSTPCRRQVERKLCLFGGCALSAISIYVVLYIHFHPHRKPDDSKMALVQVDEQLRVSRRQIVIDGCVNRTRAVSGIKWIR